jgi:hypothetical protein
MNKKLLFMLIVAISTVPFRCAASNGQATESNPFATEKGDNDTLIVNYPRKVTVITGDSLQTVRIEGRHDDYDFHYENTLQLVDSNYVSTLSLNPDRWEFSLPIGKKSDGKWNENEITTHIGVGGCTALNAQEPMDVSMNSSFEIFWTIAQWDYTRKGSRHTFSTGIGVDWRNYRMNSNHWRFEKLRDDNVAITPYPSESIRKQFSRIKVFSLQVPLLYRYRIGHGFALSAGPVLNLNMHSSLKTRYKLDGQKYKDTANDVHANPVTVDLMGIVCTPVFDIYVKYSPCNVLKTDYAPKFQSLSVGIYI